MTPLTGIRGYVETLQMRELGLDEETRLKYLAIVEHECDRLEHLLADLRELSQVDAGGGAFSPGRTLTTELFDRIRRRHEREIRERRLRFDVEVGGGAAEVWADRYRLEQAVENLVTNAIRHTEVGGRISLHAIRADDTFHIRVADNGSGIQPEHLPFVFDRFYTPDLTRGSSGSGLGLSIVKAIAERHQGRVGVTSRPGVETVFEIVLPTTTLRNPGSGVGGRVDESPAVDTRP
ncbi:MAG: HAMP domain-containing histidine kinase [Acidobacteria bacterium]|nr:HAMP domain-containing histidine kinase [Acidobacteriota bacterium]